MSSSGRILVVDDDPGCLDFAISLLASEGYLVRPAMSGEAALEPMAAWLPDLILLDVRMPGMGGFETCRRLRTSGQTADVPLIFLSAAESVEEHLEGLALGAVDFIVKPLRREELLARVRTQIELGRLRAGLRLRGGDDVSPARHTESAFDDPERRFRNLADTAPMMICASGPDKRATFFNKAWLSFTGRALEQEIGNGWTEGVHPDDLESAYASYAASFDARRKCHIQYRVRHADGEYRWIVCCGVPQYASSGTFTGYIASCMDITELRRTQEEAFERQKLEGLRVLTGGIAHDFNNLLGSILAETDLAEADLAEGASPLEGIVRIKGVANRAAEIVRELMIYSGQDTATLEPVDVSRLVENMLALLKVSISKHARVKTDFARHLPAVLGNAAQIRQVVMNLILNASEAIGGKDGVIQITTSKVIVPDGPIEPAMDARGSEYVRLEISDSGCGMAEETKARVFDPFFTTKLNGHGLGLAAVQGIVRLHAGIIRVASTPGRGSTFTVLLPTTRELMGQGSADSATAPDGILAGKGTVLLVDEEDPLRVAIAKALRRRGFSILSAADGLAAVDALQHHAGQIGAIVLDLTLATFSGLEALKQMRLIQPAMQVILTSAYAWNSGDPALAEFAPVAFLRKPYRIDDLVRTLCQALSGAAPGRKGDGHGVGVGSQA